MKQRRAIVEGIRFRLKSLKDCRDVKLPKLVRRDYEVRIDELESLLSFIRSKR